MTLRVEPREGELVTTNNEVSTFVTVRAGGINVLCSGGQSELVAGRGRNSDLCGRQLALAGYCGGAAVD